MKNKQTIALISLAMKITFTQLLLAGLFLSSVCAKETKGQDIFNKKVSISAKNTKLKKVLVQLENIADIKFVYSSKAINVDKPVNIVAKQEMLSDLLNKILEPFNIRYKVIDGLILLYEDSLASDVQINASININLSHANNDSLHRRIIGFVSDQKGAPIINASVVIAGTQRGTVTDAQGRFSLATDDNDKKVELEVSHIGYITTTVTVTLDITTTVTIGGITTTVNLDNKNGLHIILSELASGLNEVVVVGYQTQRRSDITGALSTVKASEIAKQPIGFADQALQGKASGVRINQVTGQPGDGVAIRIRGVGSIGDDAPLFVIDGVPTKDGINFLPAGDIATITVLKDAASAAIYGARSANGVIVITTKSGAKQGKAQITYSGYSGIQTHGYLTPMTNAQEYKTLFNEAVANDDAISTNPSFNRAPISDTVPMANTNWLASIFRTAPIQSHELSITGGNDKTQYAVSANIFNQDGIVLNSWYKRYTLHTKLNIQATDKLAVGVNTNFSYYDKNAIGSSGDGLGGNGGNAIRYALFRDPAIPIYNPDGSYTDKPADYQFFGDGYNPVALANNTNNIEKQYRVFGDMFLEYKILKNLKFKTDFGGDIFFNIDKDFSPTYGSFSRINSINQLVEGNTLSQNMLWNNTLQYNKVFNKVHNITVLVGTEALSNSTVSQSVSEKGFPIQTPNFQYLNTGVTQPAIYPSESPGEWASFSLFANVNYNYNSLYYLTFSDRRDGSSRFGSANQYGNFPSASAGWRISNEKWFKNKFDFVSKLMLRGSYGKLGNDQIGDYPQATIVSPGYNAIFGSTPASNLGYAISANGNPYVEWESSTQSDAGLDIGILRDRLTLSVDYFDKTTNGALQTPVLSTIGGSATAPSINIGSIQNQGLEFELNYTHDEGQIQYSFNANLATIQNKVLSLYNDAPIYGGRINDGVYATKTAVGHPIGSFFGYQMEGIFQTQAQIFTHAYQGVNIRPGDVMYKDVNGDGKIDANDETYLGSAIPKFTYGFTANVAYKGFDLSAFFQGSYGNKIYSQVNQDIEGFYRPFNLTQRVYDERWHGPGTSNTMPLVSWTDATNNVLEPSSRFIEDGSYVRLKNLQIGYSIPAKVLDRIHIKGLRFYFTGENLITITKFTGLDPEMQSSNNTSIEAYPGDVAAGIDWGTYPSAKSYIIGANLTF